jgi:ankyrin repeat protein
MSGILIDQLMTECKNGSVEGVKSTLAKSKDINVTDKEGKGLVHHAVINNRDKMLQYLISEGAELDMQDTQGNTAMHFACELELREVIILLLINKANPMIKNNKEKYPGEDNPEISIFLDTITEEEKCFKILSPEQTKVLTSIFSDIDYDKTKKINRRKSVAFNHFVDPKVGQLSLERDVDEFLESVAIINKEDVSLNEWLFGFSKLLFCDKNTFNKFL